MGYCALISLALALWPEPMLGLLNLENFLSRTRMEESDKNGRDGLERPNSQILMKCKELS